jgi:hypothetical protein
METKAYRIPTTAPNYYRRGTLYEPGSIVRIPIDEKPSKHWVELKPGVTQDETRLTALEAARAAVEDAKGIAEEAARKLDELELAEKDQKEAGPKRGLVEDEEELEGDDDPDAAVVAEGGGRKGKKGKRAADQDL